MISIDRKIVGLHLSMRYPLYEDDTGICVTYTFSDNNDKMDLYVEISTEDGFDTAHFTYPDARFYDVNMGFENLEQFMDALNQCHELIQDIWEKERYDAS